MNSNIVLSTILHMSDLHFGSDQRALSEDELQDGVSALLRRLPCPPILIISGDITYKGATYGFERATKFFSFLLDQGLLDRRLIVACPGNHDIRPEPGHHFLHFDKFIYSLRRDEEICFAKNDWLTVEIGDFFFLLINSAYHADYTHGEVPELLIRELANGTVDFPVGKLPIAVVHHHLIGVERLDTSTIRNAYGLMAALDKVGFRAIVHGHQHAGQKLPVGQTPVEIFSARSINFREPGIVNGLTRTA